MRIFAVPDIHGRLDRFIALMDVLVKSANFDITKDRLIFLGDYVDRGPDSRGVLNLLQQYQKDGAIVILGNHEDMLINMVKTKQLDAMQLCVMNGGDQTLQSYWGSFTFPKGWDGIMSWCTEPDLVAHVDWLETLPLYHEENGFFFSHAPIPHYFNHYTLALTDKKTLIWSYMHRGETEAQFAKHLEGGLVGVCGHIHALRQGITEPRLYPHYLYLDSGCGCADYGPLVACEVTTRTVYFDDGRVQQDTTE